MSKRMNLNNSIRWHLENLDRSIEELSDQIEELEFMRKTLIKALLDDWCHRLDVHKGTLIAVDQDYHIFDETVPKGTTVEIKEVCLSQDYRSIYATAETEFTSLPIRISHDNLMASRKQYVKLQEADHDA